MRLIASTIAHKWAIITFLITRSAMTDQAKCGCGSRMIATESIYKFYKILLYRRNFRIWTVDPDPDRAVEESSPARFFIALL